MNPTHTAVQTPGVLPQLKFTHAGVDRTLNKHATVRAAIKAGTMTVEEAMQKPWYLRLEIAGKERPFRCAIADKDAIRAAKDILNGRIDHPSQFSEFLAARDAKRGVTIGQLATAWFEAGLPFSKTRPRTPEAAATLKDTLTRTLDWWSAKTIHSINHTTIEDFVVYRRANHRQGPRYTGSRTADLQLAALSCLCQWAMRTGRLETNPFAAREKFTTDVKHCHEAMPDNDQQLHTILQWFFEDPANLEQAVAGAWLCLCTLTGLRPGEPDFLIRQSAAKEYPANLKAALPGLIYPMPDGSQRMKVQRLKRGQNPAVTLHPALVDFLNAWNTWLDDVYPKWKTPDAIHNPLFPGINQERVNDLLTRACKDLSLPQMKPHGFGRAYYVRVRRSQGADDTTIAVELGQSTNGKLIRSTYGDPQDAVGGNLHDWLPTTGTPAWNTLKVNQPSNIVTL